MSSITPPPKAILLDIGGVCVLSPFQAIRKYELDNGIPVGYINYALSRHSPFGFFHRLERGEIGLDEDYYRGLADDLSNKSIWSDYCLNKTQSQIDQTNIVENTHGSRNITTQSELPLDPECPPVFDGKNLFWRMMRVSKFPDPHVFPAVQKLRRSGNFIVGALSNAVVFPPGITDDRGIEWKSELVTIDRDQPDKATLDEVGLWSDSDPTIWINYANAFQSVDISSNMAENLDFFLNSAVVGLRKPDPNVYHYALEVINRHWKQAGKSGVVEPSDVLFLDDIGENLKSARNIGFRTIKVNLGQSADAVALVERETGIVLIDDKEGVSRL